MADKKISALTSASTPLAGTEVLPIVQSSSTVKVSVADLTAGRAVSALSLSLTNSLGTSSGGTGLSSFTANGVVYASSTSAITTGSALNFDGSNLGVGGAAGTFTSTIYATNTAADMGVSIYSANNSGTPSVRLLNGLNSSRIWLTGDGSGDLNFGAPRTTTTARFQVLGSGDVKVNTGNLIQGTAAKGINFTANTAAAGMTSQLLNWYEEGTWTPVYQTTNNNASLTMSGSTYGKYTRIGRQVFIEAYILTSAVSSVGTGDVLINGLPFTVLSGANGVMNISFSRRWNSNPPVSGVATGTSIALLSVNHVTGYPGNTTATAAADISTVADTMNIISIAGFYLV
jgi:hypothetical protein